MNQQLPHRFRALHEGPIWFSSHPETSKAEMHRDREKQERKSEVINISQAVEVTSFPVASSADHPNSFPYWKNQQAPRIPSISPCISASQCLSPSPFPLPPFLPNLPAPARAQHVHRQPALLFWLRHARCQPITPRRTNPLKQANLDSGRQGPKLFHQPQDFGLRNPFIIPKVMHGVMGKYQNKTQILLLEGGLKKRVLHTHTHVCPPNLCFCRAWHSYSSCTDAIRTSP